MFFRIQDTGKASRRIFIFTLWFLVCYSFALVLAQIKPFWIDEWRLIYNLKYKSPAELWGQLEFVQQFPRLYLQLVKAFTAPFDYSYFTLRLPSFIAGSCAIFLAYRLMKKIYPAQQLAGYLFVLMIVSSHTFTSYFIQVKQYTMDILLSLAAIWQLLELLKIANGDSLTKKRYIFLSISFFAAPFFSYTYPIAVLPVFLIMFPKIIQLLKSNGPKREKMETLFMLLFPLVLCTYGIITSYITDVSQVMKDNGMHQYWGYLMMNGGFDAFTFVKHFYLLFAEAGSGLIFQAIFGLMGISGTIYACIKCCQKKKWEVMDYLLCYSILIIAATMALFVAGKLPIGEPRLNVFTLPAIALIIIAVIQQMRTTRSRKIAVALSVVLFAGAAGHVYTSSAHKLLGNEYSRALDIYENTEDAIILAQEKKIPIFITPDIAFPDQKTHNFPHTKIAATDMFYPKQYTNTGCGDIVGEIPGDWVLKTFPAYKPYKNIPVYALATVDDISTCMKRLPASVRSVIVGNGRTYHEINRY